MWPVSERFLNALRGPQRRTTTITVTVPSADPVVVELKTGTVTVDVGSRVRRRANISIVGDAATFELLSTPGVIVTVEHGLSYASDVELVPVITGEVTALNHAFGDGTISFQIVDFGQWLSRCRFPAPYVPSSTANRVNTISSLVTDAKPDVSVANTASDTGTVGEGRTWTENRWDAIGDLATDANVETFFLPDGSFLIRDVPDLSGDSVWTVNAGDGGVLKTVTRTRPLDRLYNTVIVRPTATDGEQTWSQQTATVPADHPRHPSKIGTVPYFYASPTITSAANAATVANTILNRVLGTMETLSLGFVSNPALEGNDIIRIITPNVNQDPGVAFRHFVDSFRLDLKSGEMTADTRSQETVDE